MEAYWWELPAVTKLNKTMKMVLVKKISVQRRPACVIS